MKEIIEMERYEEPMIEVITFESEDVITDSPIDTPWS